MSEEFLYSAESFFMALADKTRLRLLNLMRGGEVCVCFFAEVLGESQPKISRHLAYLRNAGIVAARRDGKWAHYGIVEPEDTNAARILQDTLIWLDSQVSMREDYEKLANVCCAPSEFTSVANVPKPVAFAETNTARERAEIETYLL